MAAWFRLKYPHFNTAAWASSAVVNPVDDMWMFDENLYIATRKHSEACPKQIQDITYKVERDIIKNGTERAMIFKQMKADPTMHNGDFAYYFADVFVGAASRGKRTHLCDLMNSIQTFTYED